MDSLLRYSVSGPNRPDLSLRMNNYAPQNRGVYAALTEHARYVYHRRIAS
jgi:hypothetical protein